MATCSWINDPGGVQRTLLNTKVNFVDLSVVVNATGGGSDIVAKQIPGRASRPSDGKSVAYIVDFWHSWDTDAPQFRDGKGKPGPLLSADKQRKKAYQQLGFEQRWANRITDLPFLDAEKAAASASASYRPGS